MKRDVDEAEIERAEIRAIQALYPLGHAALVNWGHWSRDRYKIGPKDAVPGMWDEAIPSKFGDFADDNERAPENPDAEVKAERAEKEPYDEKAGTELDERMHAHDGLPDYLRDIVKVAYVSREVPEDQFHRHAGCVPATFRERLAQSLQMVERWTL